MSESMLFCICCGAEKPNRYSFRPGHPVCRTCEALTVSEIALMTKATSERNLSMEHAKRSTRKASKRALLLEQYRQAGKRCGSCWHFKPANEFGVCNPRPDGLQPNCKVCNRIQVAMLQHDGGRQQWRAYRDLIRVDPTANIALGDDPAYPAI